MKVMSEQATLDACATQSIARLGDGEARIAIGGGCSSQKADPKLAAELRAILAKPQPGLLPCIPNFAKTPRRDVWDKYARPPFAGLYKLPQYGSSFITRPDNAPWIDTPKYWAQVRRLWWGKVVTTVSGEGNEPLRLEGAAISGIVTGPRVDAYSKIDELEEEIGTPSHPVVLSLGACATVLAARLAVKGVHALDLGHIFMFAKHAGAYAMEKTDLVSKGYAKQLQLKHASMKWGSSGKGHAEEVLAFAKSIGAGSVLDYGAGTGTLAPAIKHLLKCNEYEPGIAGKDHLPKPADLICSFDVMEHVEPDKIDAVLRHQFALASKGAYFIISLAPARELLPDGRNAHILLQPAEWWLEKLTGVGWTIAKWEKRKGLNVWCTK